MQFGVMAMQIEALIPPGLPPERMLEHVAHFDHARLVGQLAEAGFHLVELGGDLAMFMPQSFAPPAIEALAALKEKRGLSYTVHLPLWSVELSTPLAPVREGSVQAVLSAIRATLPLEPSVYVLHATGSLAAEFYTMRLPELAGGFLLRQFQRDARRSLERILSESGLPGRRLAIETVQFPLDLTVELAEALDLSICLDTGHVLVGFSGPVELFEALERCLPRLAEVHLHDGPWQGAQREIGYGKDHRPLGQGDLEVARFLDRLDQAGFDGPIIFELRLEQALASLEVVRALRPQYLA